MTDRKLIVRYEVVAPLILGIFDGPDIARYVDAEMCCDEIDSLLGWMINVSSHHVDDPRVELYSFSDVDPSAVGAISFCPFCGAKIELRRVKK